MYRDGVEFQPPIVSDASVNQPTSLPTQGWRVVCFVTWIAALAALIAVAISSRTIGQPIWWLGTRTNPAPAVVMLVPLSVIVLPLVASWRAPHIMVRSSIICSILLTASSLPNFDDSIAIAIAVAVIGFASFLSSIAQLLVVRKYR